MFHRFLVAGFLGLVLLSISGMANAASRAILVTGYWPPTNEMLQRWSPDPQVNPAGWIGKNWENQGYDVYAYFPQFPDGQNSAGVGPFRVDYASTFNDFFKYTELLHPVAIVSFGNGPAWTLEKNYPAYFNSMFVSEQIPSTVGTQRLYPIPVALKKNKAYQSSLPMTEIMNAINLLGLKTIFAVINTNGDGGNFLCGFLGYLEAWYHSEHSRVDDPYRNDMAGFTHVSTEQGRDAVFAVRATLAEIVKALQVREAQLLNPKSMRLSSIN